MDAPKSTDLRLQVCGTLDGRPLDVQVTVPECAVEMLADLVRALVQNTETPPAQDPPEAIETPIKTVPLGVNLDMRHPLGQPDAARLGGLKWLRFVYNVSDGRGSTDLEAAHARYRSHIQRYHDAGYKVLLCFTHETYGEGRNEFWPWSSMAADKWKQLSGPLAAMAGRIAQQYRGIVDAYQIWNEPDAQPGAEASVTIQNPADYGGLFAAVAGAIRAVDGDARVIAAGLNSGPGKGNIYAKQAIAAMGDQLPDGIAFHPYGRGVGGKKEPYNLFGDIGASIAAYAQVLPDKKLWITEFGVQNRRSDPPENIHAFLSELHQHVQTNYSDQVETMILHPWAMSMHNTYGVVDESDRPIAPLYDWLTG